jgi:hypothetical protein
MPPALFVRPVIAPEPLIFIVPVFVKLARAVVVVPAPERLIIPLLVRVVTEQVPLRAIVPVAAFVNMPVPAKAVAIVNELLLVRVTAAPVTVTLGIVNVPISAWLLVLNVCMPVLAVKVPLLVIPPWKVGVVAAVSFHVEPALIVTEPVIVNAIAAEIVNVAFVAVPSVIDANAFAGATLRVG